MSLDVERKFNPYHDRRGRFTFAPDGAKVPARTRRAPQAPRKSPLKPVKGYPEDTKKLEWRNANDEVFVRAAQAYDQAHGFKPGDDGYVDGQFLKAWAMVESGGEGDKAQFLSDPFQVNKGGDWAPEKRAFGLSAGQKMTPEASARAALLWLNSKSYMNLPGKNGVLTRQYVGLKRGLARYNAKSTIEANGKPHYVNYANRIFQLAGR